MAFTSAVNTENIKAGKLHHSRGRHFRSSRVRRSACVLMTRRSAFALEPHFPRVGASLKVVDVERVAVAVLGLRQ